MNINYTSEQPCAEAFKALYDSSILDDCRDAGIADVQLFSAKGKSLFYEKLGFSLRPDDAPGMQLKAAT